MGSKSTSQEVKAGRLAGAGEREPLAQPLPRARGLDVRSRRRTGKLENAPFHPAGRDEGARLQGRAHPGPGARTRTCPNMAVAATRSPKVSPAAPWAFMCLSFPLFGRRARRRPAGTGGS